ncbi:hypothetical protein D3C87_1314320 [compost metagenome]
MQLHPVEQQIIALPGVLIPQRLGDEQQAPSGPGPVHQLINLPWAHVVAVAQQQQAVLVRLEARQNINAVGVADNQALFAQVVLGREVRIGLRLGRRAVIDFCRVGRGLDIQVHAQRDQKHGDEHAEHHQPVAPIQCVAPGPNNARQPSHNSRCKCAAGKRCP